MLSNLLWLLTFFSFLFSCDAPQAFKEDAPFSITIKEGYVFPYDFKNPDKSIDLENELLEISGLSILNEETIAAIQDEDGVIFLLNKKGKITRECDFHKKGDYEGVEVVGNMVYAVKSNGKVYVIENLGESNQELQIFETYLNKLANIEGLGYDKKNNRLLLAAKGKMAEDPTFSRAVYGFDLNENKLAEKPLFTIDLEQVHDYLDSDEPVKHLEKISEKLDPAKGGFTFGTSGIAVHPITGNYYLISSIGKMLMVVSPEGEIIHIEKFKKKIHPQPEGICFESDGTMWIANEGNKSKPSILKFKYKK